MKVPLVYICIYNTLKERSIGMELEIKEVFRMLSSVYHIKKQLRYPVLKEMEDFKLITKINSNRISMLKSSVDINNTSKIYRSVGLY